jgi:hypothetical protein
MPLLAVAMVVPLASPALAHDSGAHAPRTALLQAPETEGDGEAMSFVENLPHEEFNEGDGQNGTDIEFLTVDGRDYALAGTGRNGMQIADITDPTNPTRAAVYECPINQGDVQVFRQGERVLASYTADSRISSADGFETAACITDANAMGAEIDGSETGTFLVDLTDPTQPETVSFFEVERGSHNQSVHPSGDYLYNSNSDLITNSVLPQITITDISDPANPVLVQNFSYPPAAPTLSEESHDIQFSGNGTRAYVASLAQALILDTTDPENPEVISQFQDPANSLVHGAKLISLPREDGTTRDLLLTTDEQAGALPQSNCPGGGLHVYDITGDKVQDPLANKQGTWFIPVAAPAPGMTCTAHVLRFYPEQQLVTIAWYSQGVRTLDVSGLAEFEGNPAVVARGDGAGITEVGNFVFPDSDTWSFKTNRIDTDGYEFDGELVGGRSVPALEPQDLGEPDCDGVPVASAYVDRDQARGVHQRAIDCVIARFIAQGSVQDGELVYRPTEDVSRGQMATFILNTLRASGQDNELPAPKADAFDDIDESIHREAIAILAAAGIVKGTSGGTSYEPQEPVNRDEMASFMVRAAQFAVEPDLAESGERSFTDVPDGNVHSETIAVGDDNGLFQGTTATTFDPTVVVKRDQMASFLTNLLGVAGDGSTVPAGTG